MRKNILSLVEVCVLMLASMTDAHSALAQNTISSKIESKDPDGALTSCVATSEMSPSTTRYRIWGDFDGDGREDVAVSSLMNLFGNAGGDFEVYLKQKNGNYLSAGSFFAHPKALSLDPDALHRGSFWAFLRRSSSSGIIMKYTFGPNGIAGEKVKMIHPGDDGPSEDQRTYAKLFDTNHGLRIELISSCQTETVRDYLTKLPVEAFDSTTDGLTQKEKELLLKAHVAGCWTLDLKDDNTAKLKCSNESSSVTLHIYSGQRTLLGVETSNGQNNLVTFWEPSSKPRSLKRIEMLEKPNLQDFLGSKIIGVPPRIAYVHGFDQAFNVVCGPHTWMEPYFESHKVKYKVRYSWDGSGFVKHIEPLEEK